MVEVFTTKEFDTWLRKLRDRQAKLRIVERIDRLASGNPGDVKPVGHGISELRLTYGPGDRVYYVQEVDRLVVLLCGGDKSSQHKDIDRAYRLAEKGRESEDSNEQE